MFESHRSEVARLQTRALATRLDGLATKAEVRIDPMVTKFIDRLPSPLDRVATDMVKQAKQFRVSSHQFVLKTLAPKDSAPVDADVSAAVAPKASTVAKVTSVAKATKTVTRRTTAKV
jgi:hypothetical protein